MPETQHKAGGNRKQGRNIKKPCKMRYVAEKRQEKNRIKKLLRHFKRYPEQVKIVMGNLKDDMIKTRVQILLNKVK